MENILFHVHSKYSYDSFMDPKKIVERAKALGYQGVAITDHGNIQGSVEAKPFETKDFRVLIGGEYHTKYGDIVGINLTKNITSTEPEQIVSEIKNQGGTVIWVHPRRTFLIPRGRGKQKPLPPAAFLHSLDYIETHNAHTRPSQNRAAKAVAIEYKIPEIQGLDAHFYYELKKNYRGYSFAGYLGTFFAKIVKKISASPTREPKAIA